MTPKSKKIIIGVILLGALATGAYLYFRKPNKEEEIPLGNKEEPKQDPVVPIKNVKPVTKATTPIPPVTPSMIGKVFKSRGKNSFKRYQLKDVPTDVKQSDGTYKRMNVRKYVEISGPSGIYSDGEVIGKVGLLTNNGFFIDTNSGFSVWAQKDLLTQ